MSLIPWSKRDTAPARFRNLQSDMDELFQSMLEGFSAWPGATPGGFSPAVDIKEGDGFVTATVELPGVEKKDLDVQVTGDTLTLRGEKKQEKTEQKENWWRKETFSGSFMRRIALPCEVDGEHAEAKMDGGVLSIRMPKIAGKNTKSIKVG